MKKGAQRATFTGMGRLRLTPRLPALPPFTVDVLLALALTSVAQLEIWLTLESREAVVVAAATLMTLSIAWRRRAPLVTVTVATGGLTAQSLLTDAADAPLAQFVAFFVGVYSVAAHCPLRRALIGGALSLASAWIATAREHGSGAQDYVYVSALVAGPWLAGWALRGRRLRATMLEELAHALEREREEKARAAVAEERARIARELHDIVAHNVSVMVLQAGGERRVLNEGGGRTREVLSTIEQAGRQALGEMGRLIEMLRKDDEGSDDLAPQPGIENLDLLIEQVAKAGLPTELRVEGDPVPLPRGVEVSAYRIVQEALTNALRHAGPARAVVAVRYHPREIELEIVDDGSSSSGEEGGGHGLIGMRERVAVYGGEFHAGPRPDGGYAVRAT